MGIGMGIGIDGICAGGGVGVSGRVACPRAMPLKPMAASAARHIHRIDQHRGIEQLRDGPDSPVPSLEPVFMVSAGATRNLARMRAIGAKRVNG
jgi:hypothetical protein